MADNGLNELYNICDELFFLLLLFESVWPRTEVESSTDKEVLGHSRQSRR